MNKTSALFTKYCDRPAVETFNTKPWLT